MKIVTTRGSCAVSATSSDTPISGRAGSMMSIDIAVIDINSAISAMNSRNGRGNRAAVGSEMGEWDGFKRAYVHDGRWAACSRAAAQQDVLRELRDRIARQAQNCPFTLDKALTT